MSKRLIPNQNLNTYYYDYDSNIPELDLIDVLDKSTGMELGETSINPFTKRIWMGMGRRNTPFELSNVILLNNSGETPDINVLYNAGTLIINTVDNLAWVGTGNQTTNGSFVSINGGGGVSSLDGGTF